MIVIKQHKYGNFHTKSVTCFGGRKSLSTRDEGGAPLCLCAVMPLRRIIISGNRRGGR